MVAGLDDAGVAVLGEVPAGSARAHLAGLDWTMWLALVPSAIALTLVTTAEGCSSRARTRRSTATDRPEPRPVRVRARQHRGGRERQLRRWGHRRRAPPRWTRPGRGPSCPRSCCRRHPAPAALRHGAARRHPLAGDRRDRRVAILPLLGIREFIGLWRPTGSSSPSGRRASSSPSSSARSPASSSPSCSPCQPRQARRQPRHRRARHERLADRFAPRGRARRLGRPRPGSRHPPRRAPVLRERRRVHRRR